MPKWYMWKYDTIQIKKNKWKHWCAQLKINVFSAASDSTNWAIQADIKQFSKLHLAAEYASPMFWFHCNVNMVIRYLQHNIKPHV